MKKIKWITICLLVVITHVAGAQTKSDTSFRLVLLPDSTELTKIKEVKSFDMEGNVCIITCSKDESAVQKILNAISKNPKAIVAKASSQSVSLSTQTTAVPHKLYQTSDDILNIRDTSIFIDDFFLRIDTLKIHPSRFNYYYLISDIRQFKMKLEALENIRYSPNINDQVKTMLREMDELFLRIRDNKEQRYLSPEQEAFYKDIKDKYFKYDSVER